MLQRKLLNIISTVILMRNKYDIDKFIITNKGGNVNYFPPFYYILMVQSPPKYLTPPNELCIAPLTESLPSSIMRCNAFE